MSVNNLVEIINSTPITTSLKVAEYFSKDHSKVLASIRGLVDKDNEADFGLVDYVDSKGETRPMFNLTKDGFTLLAMGFTGKKALEFKKAYIKAFNAMEEKLKANVKPASELTVLDILKLNNQLIEKLENQLQETQKTLEHKQSIIIEKAEQVPAITMRNTINRVVREYAKAKQATYSFVWHKLYKEFKYHYSTNLELQAKNRGKKTIIEMAEELNKLEDLYNLSLKMFEI